MSTATDTLTYEAANRAIASAELRAEVARVLHNARAGNWAADPVAAMEAEILRFFGWSTGGKPLTASGLEPWKIAAVLQVETHYQTRWAAYWAEYFGPGWSADGLADAAADLPTDAGKSAWQFAMARVPAELAAFLRSAAGLAVLAGVAGVAVLAWRVRK